ncbi:Cytochrome P450 71A25 [Senna tora]|uniref:Cytochrome P450 71A25 n=1 Tax=Senna tora TaxID=362788 RepID=A0A834W898_9FABA|nr:Cytochrome P450 71A25 [Senna tora]
MTLSPREYPGHILLPAPKGKSSKVPPYGPSTHKNLGSLGNVIPSNLAILSGLPCFGFFSNSDIVHSTVTAELSVPPAIKKSSQGIKSPIFKTPFNRNNSSSIFLNSSGETAPFSLLSVYFFPSTILLITLRLKAHPTSLSPVGTVRGPRDVGVIVGGVLPGGELRTARYGGVVGFEEGFGHFDGRAHHDWFGPKPNLHDGPVLPREGVDGAVWEWAYEIEVAYDGPWSWAWGPVVSPAVAEMAAEEEDDDEGC